MTTVIIDNEEPARAYLREMIGLFCPEVQILASATGVEDGIQTIKKYLPDFVFLDVEMDDGSGFDLIEQLADDQLKVIFTTAYDKYAVNAIRLSAIDFLLKPIDGDELIKAVDRVKQKVSAEEQQKSMEALRSNLSTTDEPKIVLKDQSHVYLVKVNDIVYCSGEGSYTTFYLKNEEQIIISKNLKVYEKILPKNQFYRTHTSYIVNLFLVKKIAKGLQDIVVMEDDSQIPVSVRRKSELMKRFS